MLIVFGSISMRLSLSMPSLPETGEDVIARDISIEPSGRAANQSLAAARTGAKVALIGKVGNDEYAKKILLQLRREGVMTSGVAYSQKPTATDIFFIDDSGLHMHVAAQSANQECSIEQVPDEILKEGAILLLQTEINAKENAALLNRAKERGVKTILNLAPSVDLTKQTLEGLDTLIVNHEQAKALAAKLDMNADDQALKMAQALSSLGQMTVIITLGQKGAVAYTAEGESWQIGALDIGEVVDHNGAEDAYCGTFAACIHAGLSFPNALRRASIAGSLACTKQGIHKSFPYLDDIESRFEDLPEAQQL